MVDDTRALRAVVPIARTVRRGPTAITLLSLDVYVEGSELSGWIDVQPDHRVMLSAEEQAAEQELMRAYFASLSGEKRPVAPMVVVPPDEPFEPFRFQSDAYLPDLVIAARDNLGGTYANTAEGGSGRMGTRFEFHTTLTPPLDLKAGALTLDVEAIEWRLLPPIPRRPPDYVESGPWSFVVPLGRAALASEQASE